MPAGFSAHHQKPGSKAGSTSVCALRVRKNEKFAMYFFKVLGARYIFQSQMSFSGSQIPLKRPALLYQWKYLMLSGVGEMVQQQDGCSHRRLGFISQPHHGSSQWSVTPFPRDQCPSLGSSDIKHASGTHVHIKLNFLSL